MTESTYKDIPGLKYLQYVVQRGEDMRMDLVCNSIFGNTDYVDLLCSINRIENPLNIKEGVVLIYPATQIESLRITPVNKQDLADFANPNKTTRKDKSRLVYNQNEQNLPPTILPKSTKQFNTEGNQITLGANLF